MACPLVLSNYLINKLLLTLTNQGSWSAPATVYLALYTTNPNPNNSGAEVSTGGGSGYVRQAISWASVGSNLSVANSAVITFPTSGTNWGTINYFALFDASSAGNMLMFSQLSSPVTINIGTIFQIAIGSLTAAFQ